ncbi:MAG: metallopeptidase [Cyclobacteriaceae bacterium]|nr:MAG: metallopeptidase [Cyclobacteriaceae bacterium]
MWDKYQFNIKITSHRKTKLGDYRYRPDGNTHLITINHDLNPYAFLMVYIHEVAHCVTCINHGQRVKPHGSEWQEQMKQLAAPLLDNNRLPSDLRLALLAYLKSPKAASCSSVALTRALRKYDPVSSLIPLEQLPEGTEFSFHSRRYRKIKHRRTRVTCKDTHTHRTWLIPMLALVEPV